MAYRLQFTQVNCTRRACVWQEREGLEVALQKDKGNRSEAEKSKLERVRNLNMMR